MSLKVKIAGVERPIRENSTIINYRINSRSTASFIAVTDFNEGVRITKRNKVEIFTESRNLLEGTELIIFDVNFRSIKLTLSKGIYTLQTVLPTFGMLENTKTGESYVNWFNVPYTFELEEETQMSLTITSNTSPTWTYGEDADVNTIGLMVNEGSTALLYEPPSEVIFSGYVDTVAEKNIGVPNKVRHHAVTCVDHHYLVDKRIFAGAFQDKTVSQIVESITEAKLLEEGISYTADSIDGGADVLITATTFNYEKCNEVFDKLAERSGCNWWVDKNKVLYFKKADAIDSGKELTEDMIQSSSLLVSTNAHQYRNRQIIKGGRGTTDPRTESFKGNGEVKTFTVGFPLAHKPTIKVNGVEVDGSKIGIKGLVEDMGDYQWFWSKNSSEIVQSSRIPPLTTAQTLEVTYQGYYALVIATQDPNQVDYLSGKEGSSGIVEALDNEVNLDSKDEIFSVANSKIEKFAQESYKIVCKVQDSGFMVGQLVTVNLPSEGIVDDNNFLVESIEISEDYPITWFKLTLVKGFLHTAWAKIFTRFTKDITDAREDTDLVEMVILTTSKTKTWLYGENPNTMRDTFVSNTLICGSFDAIPMIIPEDRNTYIQIIGTDNKVKGTVSVAKREYFDGRMVSTFIVPTNVAQGDWKEIRFMYGQEGIYLALTLPEIRTKTIYDEVQVELIDIKGW